MPARPSLAVLMDPLETIKPAKDSTIAMLTAAAHRGFETLVFGQGDLWSRDGRAFARLTPIEVTRDAKAWYRIGEPAVRDLAAVSAVLMRKDPPFDMEYIYSTYLLERAERAGTLVVNRPQGLRDMNEKAYTAWFPDCCAPTLITRDMAAMEAFLAEQGRAVFKPLDGMGGRSIFVVAEGDPNTQCRAGDAHRGWKPLRDRPALSAGDCRNRRCAHPAGGRRARAACAGAHAGAPATIAATSRRARGLKAGR